jgi:hypothetical protein
MNGSASGPESSVLFSLRELRDIEHRRVADERAAANAAEEAKERARVAEVARVAAEREAALAAEHARKEAELAARNRQLAEDAIRIQETEARLRAEALVKLEGERLAYEVELRREEIARKRPRWLMGVAAGCAVVAIGVGMLAMRASDTADQSRERALQVERDRQKTLAEIAAQEKKIADLESDIRNAKSEIEKKNLEIKKTQAEADYVRTTGKKPPKTKTGGNGSGSASGGGEIKVNPDQIL